MNGEEVKPPEHLIEHYWDNGQWWEVKYLRYHQPDGRVKDYKLHRSEKPCECGYTGRTDAVKGGE